MAIVKIFLPTYKRNITLKRAVESLLSQTFTNWICEVHNDDPLNYWPSKYIEELRDSRFSFVQHEKNLGPVVTFNLMYQPTIAKYISLLEDDNWWEPDFLTQMIKILDNTPNVEMAWANMHIWQEDAYGNCKYTNKTIWPINSENNLQAFNFPNYVQALSALHSNGAMLIRNINIGKFIIPNNVRFDFVEPIRERVFNYPIVLNNRPLANFNLTYKTSRNSSIKGINEHSILLLTSYFNLMKGSNLISECIWKDTRKSPQGAVNKLLYAGLFFKNCRFLLKKANCNDWLFFLLYNIKYPTIFINCLFSKRIYKSLWQYLDIVNSIKN